MATNFTTGAFSTSAPADNSALSAGAGAIRTKALQLKERVELEHYFSGEIDTEQSDAEGRHIPGQVSGVGLRTLAQAVAGTAIATMPAEGQFVTGSDHSCLWYYDATNDRWIRATPHTFLYYTGTTVASTLTTSLADLYLDATTKSFTVNLIKGESVIIEACISTHATAVDGNDNRNADYVGYRSDAYYLLTSGTTVAVASDVATEHARHTFNNDGDGNIITSTFTFYDHEPVSDLDYTEKTYSIRGKKSHADVTAYVRSMLTKVTIIRTSALA